MAEPLTEMRTEAFKRLRALHREKHGTKPPTYKDTTERDLERCIIDYLKLKGYHAERIHCSGMAYLKDGKLSYYPTTMHKGTSDIHATIKGRFIAIEIKIGTDRQSTWQREYEADIRQAGGIYIIARSFAGFLIELHKKIKL